MAFFNLHHLNKDSLWPDPSFKAHNLPLPGILVCHGTGLLCGWDHPLEDFCLKGGLLIVGQHFQYFDQPDFGRWV
jgi:hypothetical protein